MKNGTFWKRLLASTLAVSSAATMIIGTGFSAAATDAPATEELRALKLEIDWKDEISVAGQLVVRLNLTHMDGEHQRITVEEGDVLSYDVYIPSDGNYVYGMGGVDGQLHPSWAYFPEISDKNGDARHTQLDAKGTDKWLNREFSLDDMAGSMLWRVGPSVLTGNTDLTAMAGKVSTIYYRNIKIIHEDGTADVYFGDSTAEITENDYSFWDQAANVAERTDSLTLTDGTYTFEKETVPPFEPADPTVPEDLGYAMEMALHFKPDYGDAAMPEGNAYHWYGFGAAAGEYSSIRVGAGDKLSYKLYIPGDSAYVPGMGVMDMQVITDWATLSKQEGLKDQNGKEYLADLKTAYGADKWIEITYTLPEAMTKGGGIQHIGPRDDFDQAALETLKNKTAYYYLKDVKIIHADGKESLIAPPQNKMYNVNAADDFVSPFAVTRTREVNADQKPEPEKPGPHETPSDIGHALKFEVKWLDGIKNASGTIFSSTGLDEWEGLGDIVLKNGDTLAYDVYLPSDGNPVYSLGSLDIQFSNNEEAGAAYLRMLSPSDNEGENMFTDLNTAINMDEWVTREFVIDGLMADAKIGNVGLSIFHGQPAVLAKLAGLTSTVYYRNIKIIHEDGTEDIIFGESKPFSGKKVSMEATPNVEGAMEALITEVNRPDGGNKPATGDSAMPQAAALTILTGAACLLAITLKRGKAH